MGAKREDDETKLDLGTPVSDEPEPDWADEIRRLRKERGDRLKSLLSRDDRDRPPRDGQ